MSPQICGLEPRRPHGVELGFTIADTHHIFPAFSLVGVFDDSLHRSLAKKRQLAFDRPGIDGAYPLVNIQKTMENHHC